MKKLFILLGSVAFLTQAHAMMGEEDNSQIKKLTVPTLSITNNSEQRVIWKGILRDMQGKLFQFDS